MLQDQALGTRFGLSCLCLKIKAPRRASHTHVHRRTHHISNLWLAPLIRSPPTHSHGKKDVVSLLSFHAYISNTSWCSKLVKKPSPWKCSTLWAKHDGSGSAGTNIPRVPFISRSMSIYPPRPEFLLFLHRRLTQLSPFFASAAHRGSCFALLAGAFSWLINPCSASSSKL